MAMKKTPAQPPAVIEHIENHILILRGEKVMLDRDLANLYGVPTKVLNQAVKRNRRRFPTDFMFQLTRTEYGDLNRSQIVTGSQKHRDPRYLPYAFTEHGAVMLATVLNSPAAIAASIHVVKAFVRLRAILAVHKELAKKLEEHVKTTNVRFTAVYDLIEKILKPAARRQAKIGFRTGGK